MIDSDHFIRAHNEYLTPPSTYEEEYDDPQCPSCDSFGYTGQSCGRCGYDPDPQPPLTCDWCGGPYHGQAGDLACAEAKKGA